MEKVSGHDQQDNMKDLIASVGPINCHTYKNVCYVKNIVHFENNGIFIIKTTFTHLCLFQDSAGTDPKV